MTLSILRNTHKPADICAFLGMLLGVQADSVADLASILANKRSLHRIEERVLVLALVSQTVLSVEQQEVTLEVAAAYIANALHDIGTQDCDPDWAAGSITLGKNR